MTPEALATYFTRTDGSYLCARWGRPIVPVVFGVDDATLETVKGAIEAVVLMAGHRMAETDPELGANLMVFFFREWAELAEVPDFDRLIPDFNPLLDRLTKADANQYRHFRFDADGSIKAVFVFLRMDEHLAEVPAADLALAQAAQVMLTFAEGGFANGGPLGKVDDKVILHPDVAAVICTAYNQTLPNASTDASHALRLAARLTVTPLPQEGAEVPDFIGQAPKSSGCCGGGCGA